MTKENILNKEKKVLADNQVLLDIWKNQAHIKKLVSGICSKLPWFTIGLTHFDNFRLKVGYSRNFRLGFMCLIRNVTLLGSHYGQKLF